MDVPTAIPMPGFVDNFRKSFHKFQNRRGTFFRAVRYPLAVSMPATGRRVVQAIIFCGFRRLLAPPVRLRR